MKDAVYPLYVRMMLFLFGLSFYWFSILHTIFNAPVLHHNEAYFATYIWLVLVYANTFMLGIAFCLAKKLTPFAYRNVLVFGIAALGCLGISLIFIGFNFPNLQWVSFVGAFMASTGSVILQMLFREASALLATKSSQKAFYALSAVFGMLLYLLSVCLPLPLTIALSCSAPLASAIMLRRAVVTCGGTVTVGEMAPRRPPNEKPSFVLPFPIFACCFTFALAQGVSRTNFLPMPTNIDSSWSLLISGAILMVVGVAALDFFISEKWRGALLNILFLPLATILSLTMPFFIFESAIVVNFLIFVGHLLFIICIYSELDRALSSRFLPTQVLAAGIICINIGLSAGALLGIAFEGVLETWMLGALIGGLCLAALASRAMLAQRIVDRFACGDGLSKGSEQGEADDGQNQHDLLDSVRQQCVSAMRVYSLSKREEEILEYLVRGRSAKSIAAEKSISYNTVKTHMSHIYMKIDVHNREELIKAIEDIEG